MRRQSGLHRDLQYCLVRYGRIRRVLRSWGWLVALGPGQGGVSAQAEVGVRWLGPEEGLPQFATQAIAIDPIGFAWIGTEGGLARYDGRSFRLVALPESQPPMVQAIRFAPDSAVWVGFEAGGVARAPFPGAPLTPFPTPTGSGLSVAPNRIHDLASVSAELTYVASDEGAFALTWPTDGSARIERLDGITGGCRGIALLDPETLGVGCRDGAVRFFDVSDPAEPREAGSIQLDGEVLSLLGEGAFVWVGTIGGLVRIDRATDAVRTVPYRAQLAPSTLAAEVHALHRDSFGTLWVGTRGGLFEYDRESLVRRDIYVAGQAAVPIPHPYVMSFGEDGSGVLFVGTWGGVVKVSRYREAVLTVRASAPGDDAPLPVVGLTGSGSHVWAGALGGHLARIDTETLLVDRPSADHPALGGADVYSLDGAPDGSVWVATVGTGVFRWSDGALDGVPGLGSPNAIAVHRDRQGRTWVGTNGAGLFRIDPGQTQFARVDISLEALPEDEVWPIRSGPRGGIWFGSVGVRGGVHRLDPATGEIWSLLAGGDSTSLPSSPVMAVLPDLDGTVWVGTLGDGLVHVDPRTGTSTAFTVEDGLPHDAVYGLVLDERGFLWLSTGDGLARLDRESREILVLREGVGLQGRVFHANSAYRHTDGTLWFGGPGGVTIVEPALLPGGSLPPPIGLSAVALFGEHIADSTWVGLDEIVFDPGDDFFTFEFAALDYTDPEHNRYEYRLDGLHDEWIDAGNRGVANYTAVPPDDYELLVRAANSEGVWNLEGLRVPIQVLPAFYQTAWFRAFVLLAATTFVWLLHTFRERHLRRVSVLRAQMTARVHNEIGAYLSSIINYAQIAELDQPESTGEKGGAVGQIYRIAREARGSVQEILFVAKEEHDTVQGLIKQIEHSSRMLLVEIEPNFPRTTIPDGDRGIPVEVRLDIYLMALEIVQNIVKHSGATKVDIDFRHTPRLFEIRIEDNGKGFDPRSIEEGDGLDLLRSGIRNKRLHGRLETAPGKGTIWTISARMSPFWR